MKTILVVVVWSLAVGVAVAQEGPSVDADKVMMSLGHYVQAWNEPDEAKRRAHLEASWADDATYTDPTADVRGREALVQHIAGFLSAQPAGSSIDRVTGVDIHHRSFRFGWGTTARGSCW